MLAVMPKLALHLLHDTYIYIKFIVRKKITYTTYYTC